MRRLSGTPRRCSAPLMRSGYALACDDAPRENKANSALGRTLGRIGIRDSAALEARAGQNFDETASREAAAQEPVTGGEKRSMNKINQTFIVKSQRNAGACRALQSNAWGWYGCRNDKSAV